MKKQLILKPNRVAIARPGYDVDTATEKELAFDSNWTLNPAVLVDGITPPMALTSTTTVFYRPDGASIGFHPIVRVRLASDASEGKIRFTEDPAAVWSVGGFPSIGSLFEVEIFRNRFEIKGTQRGKFFPYPSVTGYAPAHSAVRRFHYIALNVPFMDGI